MARAKSTKSTKSTVATPIHVDSRICFAIAFFLKESDAQAFGDYYRAHGHTYIGGYSDGMPTGRDSGWDFVVTEAHQASTRMGRIAELPLGTKVYAATF
jgi:hypothetical protein